MAVEVSFVFDDAAKGAGLDELGEGDEVGVPAAVYPLACCLESWVRTLVNSEERVLFLCDGA